MSKEYRYNSYKEAMKAVKEHWLELKYVRPDLQTTEMAFEAVKIWGGNI